MSLRRLKGKGRDKITELVERRSWSQEAKVNKSMS